MIFRIGAQRSTIIRLSGPIKTHWSKSLGLDINQLLGSGEYKEKYRLEMIKWSEDIRRKDYGYFCRAAIDMYNGTTKLKNLLLKITVDVHIWFFIFNIVLSDIKYI